MENYKGFEIEYIGFGLRRKKSVSSMKYKATKHEWDEGDPIFHGTLEEVKEEIDEYWEGRNESQG